MKSINLRTRIARQTTVCFAILQSAFCLQVFAQGTAFTYQGHLNDGGAPANGNYDLVFTIYPSASGATGGFGVFTNSAVAVTNGLFTVSLDFGIGVFTGPDRWLQIDVRTNGVGAFASLTPRQKLTPTPYAIFANTSSNLSGTVAATQLSGTVGGATNFTGNLNGDVTGTQSASVVSFVGGQSAANVANGALAANAAINTDTPNTIVKRDASGDFSAGTVTVANALNLPSPFPAISSGGNPFVSANGLNEDLFIGQFAGNFSRGGAAGDVGVGNSALKLDTTGNDNTAVGNEALFFNKGSYNTADGFRALYSNTNGINNVAVGYLALYSNLTGNNNVANGVQALYSDKSDDNVANGYQALYSNTSGFANTANGFQALYSNTGGIFNNATGAGALQNNSNGSDNVADGYEALFFNTTASQNTAVGFGAMFNNTTGSSNAASGYEALFNNTNGSLNTANGFEALYFNKSGIGNTADGLQALYFNVGNGSFNTANGFRAMFSNTTGSNNVANGANALFSNTTGSYDTADGYQALYSNTVARFNTASGYQALYSNTNGEFNVADGYQALFANTTGGDNIGIGYQALDNNMDGVNNIAVGYAALFSNVSGFENTALGVGALGNSTGSDNIAIGYNAGQQITGNNEILIGNSAGVSGESNTLRLGSGQTKTFISGINGVTSASGIPVYINSFGQLGTSPSSARFKQNIQTMKDESDVLLALRPVSFQYKSDLDPQGIPQFGLIAEEVDKVAPELVARDDKDQIYTVRYQAVDAMLLNEFLKEHGKVEAQRSEIDHLKERLDKLEQLIGQKERGAE
jgi:trimeric autotransporter adhesin